MDGGGGESSSCRLTPSRSTAGNMPRYAIAVALGRTATRRITSATKDRCCTAVAPVDGTLWAPTRRTRSSDRPSTKPGAESNAAGPPTMPCDGLPCRARECRRDIPAAAAGSRTARICPPLTSSRAHRRLDGRRAHVQLPSRWLHERATACVGDRRSNVMRTGASLAGQAIGVKSTLRRRRDDATAARLRSFAMRTLP